MLWTGNLKYKICLFQLYTAQYILIYILQSVCNINTNTWFHSPPPNSSTCIPLVYSLFKTTLNELLSRQNMFFLPSTSKDARKKYSNGVGVSNLCQQFKAIQLFKKAQGFVYRTTIIFGLISNKNLRHAKLSSFQKGRGKNFSEINTFLQNHSLQKIMQ